MANEVKHGERFADSVGIIWEVVELPRERQDGNVKLWNRSYNAFDKKSVEDVLKMNRA